MRVFILLFLVLVFLLSGCASLFEQETIPIVKKSGISASNELGTIEVQSNESGLFDNNGSFQAPQKDKNVYVQIQNHNINHYVRGISHSLIENLQYVNANTPLAVSSFVLLDGDYFDSDLLGNQIAESFMHEIHKFGIPVIDFKLTDYFRVTKKGDFILSRDFLELQPDLPIQYVLTGTLVKHEAGHLLNARIVGIKSKAVVASAQGFLPEYITGALKSNDYKDGIKLQ